MSRGEGALHPTAMRSASASCRVFASLLLGVFPLAAAVGAQMRTVAASAQRVPVVVELFSSEGCSDCPPADALLKQLETTQPLPGAKVIAIEEHVDYWNHDGWIDPFSSPEWTLRQEDYEAKLRAGTEYTPQMVVDGESQLVGSFAAAAERSIEIAALSPRAEVAIAPEKSDGKNAEGFSVTVGKLPGGARGKTEEVFLAVTEDGLRSSVSAGENAGHELYHAAVLRSLTKIGVAAAAGSSSFTGDARVKFSSHWNRANLRVVAFVQEKQTMHILGAAETKVAAAPQNTTGANFSPRARRWAQLHQ